MPPPKNEARKTLQDLQAIEMEKTAAPDTIVVTGLPGAGKTCLAATLFSPEVSPRLAMPAAELAKAPWLKLKGAVWIEADEQGLVSLTAKKIRPEFILSLTTLANEHNGNLSAALRDLYSYLAEAKEAGATAFVVDTATSFGAQWLVRHFVDGNDNGFAGWQSVANQQTQLLACGHSLGLRQVWLAQPTENKLESLAASKQGTELDKAIALAQSVSGGSNYVVPALSGKAFPPVLNAQCSLSGWLRVRQINGKRVREFLPFGGDGSQGKTRYEGILSDREEPDLGKIDLKILQTVSAVMNSAR